MDMDTEMDTEMDMKVNTATDVDTDVDTKVDTDTEGSKMRKWIDEIAADFVNDLIKKSKQPTEVLKAQEAHDFVKNKTPAELAVEMNISAKDWDIWSAWQYAEQDSYAKAYKAFLKEVGLL